MCPNLVHPIRSITPGITPDQIVVAKPQDENHLTDYPAYVLAHIIDRPRLKVGAQLNFQRVINRCRGTSHAPHIRLEKGGVDVHHSLFLLKPLVLNDFVTQHPVYDD